MIALMQQLVAVFDPSTNNIPVSVGVTTGGNILLRYSLDATPLLFASAGEVEAHVTAFAQERGVLPAQTK